MEHNYFFLFLLGLVFLFVIHKAGVALLKRLGKRYRFFTYFVQKSYYVSLVLMGLIWLRIWGQGVAWNTEWLRLGGLVLNIGLIVSLTLLLMHAVESAADAVVDKNPILVKDNLRARQIYTQTRVLVRSVHLVLLVFAIAFIFLLLPGVKQIGASLLASAGVAGLVAGMAAKPIVGNFIAGLQIAFTQPIRIDDVVIVEGEWGRIEEITATFVLVKVWDERRLIVPLQWFVENVFQNWTHTTASLLGTVFLWLDYQVELDGLKEEFERLCQISTLWDQRVCVMQVTDSHEQGVQIRFLVSAKESGELFDLRCQIREGLIRYLSTHQPYALIRWRVQQVKASTPR